MVLSKGLMSIHGHKVQISECFIRPYVHFLDIRLSFTKPYVHILDMWLFKSDHAEKQKLMQCNEFIMLTQCFGKCNGIAMVSSRFYFSNLNYMEIGCLILKEVSFSDSKLCLLVFFC